MNLSTFGIQRTLYKCCEVKLLALNVAIVIMWLYIHDIFKWLLETSHRLCYTINVFVQTFSPLIIKANGLMQIYSELDEKKVSNEIFYTMHQDCGARVTQASSDPRDKPTFHAR
jgi:hypothetical protein